MPKRVRQTVTITISPEVLKKVDRLAKAMGMNRSQFIERSIQDSIEDTSVSVAALTDPAVSKVLIEMFSNRDVLRTLARAFGEGASDDQLSLWASRMEKIAGQGEKKGR